MALSQLLNCSTQLHVHNCVFLCPCTYYKCQVILKILLLVLTTHTHSQTEKARHILQVRQKLLESRAPRRGVATWPSDEELSKLSDEHKAMLAQKCVNLLMRKSAVEEAATEVYTYT